MTRGYILITGSTRNIPEFEQSVQSAMEQGYSTDGNLICKDTGENHEGAKVFMLLQPMVYEVFEDLFEDEEAGYSDRNNVSNEDEDRF